MIKEDVLKVKYERVFDKYAIKIVYQNEEVLKRHEFFDCGVRSVSFPYYLKEQKIFCIRGLNIDQDDNIVIVSDDELQYILERVNEVNEKYGVVKIWRANVGGYYYTILSNGEVCSITEKGSIEDNARYELGNYFESIVEAKKVMNSIQWKELWNDVKEDKLKFGV